MALRHVTALANLDARAGAEPSGKRTRDRCAVIMCERMSLCAYIWVAVLHALHFHSIPFSHLMSTIYFILFIRPNIESVRCYWAHGMRRIYMLVYEAYIHIQKVEFQVKIKNDSSTNTLFLRSPYKSKLMFVFGTQCEMTSFCRSCYLLYYLRCCAH